MGEEKKIDLSLKSITRLVLLFTIPILAYGIAFFPAILLLYLLRFLISTI